MPDFQTIAAIIFLALLTAFVFSKKKNLDTKQIIPYIFYVSMYRTKWGIRLMDSMAKKFKKTVNFFAYLIGAISVIALAAGFMSLYAQPGLYGAAGANPYKLIGIGFDLFLISIFILLVPFDYIIIGVGFLGMISISYLMVYNVYLIFTRPEAVPGVGFVLPIKAKGVFFVPFFYWIISIVVIAVVHEFAHGLLARTYNLKVKSSGFAFVGFIIPLIPAAFVEPDEKALKKRPKRQQLSVFAAGAFSNILTTYLLVALAYFLLIPAANAIVEMAHGVKITGLVESKIQLPAQAAGIKTGEIIQQADGKPTNYVDDFSKILKTKHPGDTIEIKTDVSAYNIKLEKNPDNNSIGYLGAYFEQNTRMNENIKGKYGEAIPNSFLWISGNPRSSDYIESMGLVGFLILLNFGIGLVNLLPIGPLDGGRMFQLVLQKFFEKEKADKIWAYVAIILLLVIIINLGAAYFK